MTEVDDAGSGKRVWQRAARAADVPAGGTLLVHVGAKPIALYNLVGSIYATGNRCTHGDGSLCAGRIEGRKIECPLHLGLFDIRTGRAVGVPCVEDVRCHAVRIEDGFVYVAI